MQSVGGLFDFISPLIGILNPLAGVILPAILPKDLFGGSKTGGVPSTQPAGCGVVGCSTTAPSTGGGAVATTVAQTTSQQQEQNQTNTILLIGAAALGVYLLLGKRR